MCARCISNRLCEEWKLKRSHLHFFLDSETTKIRLFLLIKVRVIHMRLPSRLEQERFTMMNRNSTN